MILPSPSLCPALSTCHLHSRARLLWRKHGPLTLLDPCVRRDHKGHTQVDTKECVWARRRTQDQPSTKETTQKKNPPRAERALTTREPQDSITRGVQNLPTFQQRSPPTLSEPRRRCPTLGHPLNNDFDTNDVPYDVLSVVLTRRPVLKTQMMVS